MGLREAKANAKISEHGDGVRVSRERSPFYTTEEAAAYLHFATTSGIRCAVHRGELHPAGVGPHGTLLFVREELDRFVFARGANRVIRYGLDHR